MKIGIDLASLRQPFKKALLTAARLGASGVEIDSRNEVFSQDLSQTGVRQLRKMLEDLNLRVCAVRFRSRRGYDVGDDLDRRIAATKKSMRLAGQLGCPIVVNQVGTVPDPPEGPQWELLVEALSDLAAFGQHVGAHLAAETGAEAATDLKRLIEAVRIGWVAVDLNPGQLLINGFSPREAIEQLGRYIMHVHATDGVRDLARGRGIEVALGQGSAEFPELLGALENFEYRGYFTIQRQSSDHPIADIELAVKYLKNLWS